MHKNRHENFTARKQRKREKRTRFGPKKAKPGAFWVLEGKTAVKTSCGQMWEDSNRCNIRRNLVDRVQGSIGTKKPQTMRFSQGLGTSGLAGAEGLSLACRLGRFAAERHWRSLTPRHAVLEWVWGHHKGRRDGAVLPDCSRKLENRRCWFGAGRKFIWFVREIGGFDTKIYQ